MPSAIYPDARRFLQQNPKAALVRLERVRGSTPREAGAWMLVSPAGIYGTIGGGSFEYKAIAAARDMLQQGESTAALNIPLGPEIGQCCGGHVALSITRLTHESRAKIIAQEAHEAAAAPAVYIFGAGHVGRALARTLLALPVRTVLVDSRAGELELGPDEVDKRLTPVPEACVREAPPGSAFVALTHDHALDFLIVHEALLRRDTRYVGMIGSKTKRVQFERWRQKFSDKKVELDALICPVGALGSRDKRPEAIALFTAAEIMAQLTR